MSKLSFHATDHDYTLKTINFLILITLKKCGVQTRHGFQQKKNVTDLACKKYLIQT